MKKCILAKTYNSDICLEMSVDSWKETLVVNEKEHKHLEDIYVGKSVMKQVSEKKYLGDLISSEEKKQGKHKRKNQEGCRKCKQNCV